MGALCPARQLLIQQLGGAADLRGGQALDPELGHDGFDIARGDALDVHLGHGQHHGPDRTPPAFQRVRVERRVAMPGRLGHLHGHGARGRIDPLGLGAICIAPTLGRALVTPGAQEPLALDLHRQLERPREHRGNVCGSRLNQLFQDRLNRVKAVP